MTPHTRRKMIHYWVRHIRPILVLILSFTAIRSVAVDWNDVPTGSMKPTILEGDRIFVNKLAYGLKVPFTTIHLAHWSGPQRGEIVIFYNPKTGIRLVKRVVGLPGDHITSENGLLSINGKPLTYTPMPIEEAPTMSADVKDRYRFYTEQLGDYAHTIALNDHRYMPTFRTFDITVPQGMYWMMGDNRDNSADSRDFGFVPRDQILGRSSRTLFSLDYDDAFLPRKDRFLKGLQR